MRRLGAPLDGAFLMWDRFLQEIFNEQEQFLEILIERMLDNIDQLAVSQRAGDAEAEALCFWLVHIVDPKGWPRSITSAEREAIQAHIIMWCCAHPGHWAQFLGESIIQLGSTEFRSVWSEILQSGQIQGEEAESQPAADIDSSSDDERAMLASPQHKVDGNTTASWTRQAMRPVAEVGAICR
jgi:ribosomal biogenesis protein LAS1